MCKDKDEPHIHAVLRRSSTLPTNDSTQICIDITGDREGIEQNGIPHSNEDLKLRLHHKLNLCPLLLF
jgi:hypothetical protein